MTPKDSHELVDEGDTEPPVLTGTEDFDLASFRADIPQHHPLDIETAQQVRDLMKQAEDAQLGIAGKLVMLALGRVALRVNLVSATMLGDVDEVQRWGGALADLLDDEDLPRIDDLRGENSFTAYGDLFVWNRGEPHSIMFTTAMAPTLIASAIPEAMDLEGLHRQLLTALADELTLQANVMWAAAP